MVEKLKKTNDILNRQKTYIELTLFIIFYLWVGLLGMTKFKCIVSDDNEVDMLSTLAHVKNVPQFEIVGAYLDPVAALSEIYNQKPDVLFLDIDMPKISGFELRKHVMEIPVCVFITSHPEHAVESFEVEAFDFIVKPLKKERFDTTVKRILEFMEVKTKASLFESSIGGDSVYIKEGNEKVKIKLHEIIYMEALKDYTLLVTPQKRHCVLSSIGNILKEEHFRSFIRIHRSYAVQRQYIEKILTNDVQLNNKSVIPLGRSYKDNLTGIL